MFACVFGRRKKPIVAAWFTGNLLGIQLGAEAIPVRWLEPLELRDVIDQVAYGIEWVPRTYRGDYSPEAVEDEVIFECYPVH